MGPCIKKMVLGFVLVALLPLSLIVLSELGEVVVIRSETAGEVRATRIWIVDGEAGALVRGSKGKGWVDDAVRAGRIELDRGGERRWYRVVSRPTPEHLREVNDLMAAKYGVADQLIGLVRDYQEAVPLLLQPEDQGPSEAPQAGASAKARSIGGVESGRREPAPIAASCVAAARLSLTPRAEPPSGRGVGEGRNPDSL